MPLGAVNANLGPRIIGAGLAMVAVAFVGYSAAHPHPEATAPPPPPAVTPSTPPFTKPAKPSRAPRPVPRHRTNLPRAVAVASETRTGGGTPPRRPRPTTPSRPVPSPPASSPPAAASCDVGVTVLVLKACLRLGETR